MKYRNTKTGNVIDVPCQVSGENWEPAEAKADKKQSRKKTAKETETE